MWQPTRFEAFMVARIRQEHGQQEADRLLLNFNNAKEYLCQHVYREIMRQEPDLTRHDESHVKCVLDRAHDLLLDNPPQPTFSAIELYVLGMAILFHDVGNIDGRASHPQAMALTTIFTQARGDTADVRRERTVVLAVVRAHGGEASDGTSDTLKEIRATEPLYSKTVSLQNVAAILRFADELAEGPERTSEFCRMDNRYAHSAQIYHDYASITNIAVDRPNGRIILIYEIEIAEGCPADCRKRDAKGCPCSRDWAAWLGKLLDFTFGRIVKLDQERRYGRYYAPQLAPFVATEVSMNFHWRTIPIPMNLPPIRLDEKVVPGEHPAKQIPEAFPAYRQRALLQAMGAGLKVLERR